MISSAVSNTNNHDNSEPLMFKSKGDPKICDLCENNFMTPLFAIEYNRGPKLGWLRTCNFGNSSEPKYFAHEIDL